MSRTVQVTPVANLSGSATINGQQLGKRDALGVWDTASLDIQVGPDGAEVLLQDVPMEL